MTVLAISRSSEENRSWPGRIPPISRTVRSSSERRNRERN